MVRMVIWDLYLHFNKTFCQQILQGCDLLWRASTHQTTRIFDHVIRWYYMANSKLCISTSILFCLMTMDKSRCSKLEDMKYEIHKKLFITVFYNLIIYLINCTYINMVAISLWKPWNPRKSLGFFPSIENFLKILRFSFWP